MLFAVKNRKIKMDLVFCGMKHCGKTTHGRNIAKHLGWNFIDTDDLIPQRYAAEHGKELSVRRIYHKLGETVFREMEAEIIEDLLREKSDEEPRVISLGGGLPTNDHVAPLLAELGLFVYIKTTPDELLRRILRKGLPPFLDLDDPRGSFLRLYNKREPYYLKHADLIIELPAKGTVQENLQLVIQRIEEALNERQQLR
jgi:shikimate kinase